MITNSHETESESHALKSSLLRNLIHRLFFFPFVCLFVFSVLPQVNFQDTDRKQPHSLPTVGKFCSPGASIVSPQKPLEVCGPLQSALLSALLPSNLPLGWPFKLCLQHPTAYLDQSLINESL